MLYDRNKTDMQTYIKERWSHWDKPVDEILFRRFTNMLKLYEDKDSAYPREFIVIGFNKLVIKSREEHWGRIRELCDLVFFELEKIS